MTLLVTSSGGRPLADEPPEKSTLAFRAGLVLIVASHAVYPLYAALPFLDLSRSELAAVGVGSSLASWGIFSLGVALAGKNAMPHVRRVIRRAIRRRRLRRRSRTAG